MNRMAFRITQHGLNNVYLLTVCNRNVCLQSVGGTANALSNVFGDKAAELSFRLAPLTNPAEALALIIKHLPRYLSGPDEGRTTYTAEGLDDDAPSIPTIARVRADLESMIDSNNDTLNTAEHASPAFKAAQTRSNALHNALSALEDA